MPSASVSYVINNILVIFVISDRFNVIVKDTKM